MNRARHALDRPLDAAAAASQAGRWDDAIALWRDQLRRDRFAPLAMACIAEAALRTDRQGLADQMLVQFEDEPDVLPKLRAREIGDCSGLSDIELADRFVSDHPLGSWMPVRSSGDGGASIRPIGSHVIQGPRAAQLTQRIDQLQESQGREAVRDYIAHQLRQSARLYRSRECVCRAILGLWRAGYGTDSPVMRDALARWDALDRGGPTAVLEEARLQRGLRFYAHARRLLRQAIKTGGGDGARLRGRLAKLADERHRWADDADLLMPGDFASGTPRQAFEAMRDAFGEDGARGDPLENAFAWLLSDPARTGPPYAPENRLLMVGNTLACGGMERVMAATYRHFDEHGSFDAVDIALLAFDEDGESSHYADLAGVQHDDIVMLDLGGPAPMPFALLPGSWKERCRKLHDHIAATRPSVIHAWNDLTGLLAAYAGLVAGCPKVVVHFHHGPSQPLGNLAEQVASYPAVFRMLLDLPAFTFLFCSEAAARDYAAWWGVPHSKQFKRVYNGFEKFPVVGDRTEVREKFGLPVDATLIGTIGRLSGVKQPRLWADAAIALADRRPDVHFVWAGEGLERDELATVFEEAGIADRLHLPGQVDNVPEWLAAFDIFWQTSASEGLPNALIEAQLAGVPVIAFDVGGVSETIIAGETGALVAPRDTPGLVEETLARLGDPDWMANAREEARMQAETRFSAGQFYAALGAVYS